MTAPSWAKASARKGTSCAATPIRHCDAFQVLHQHRRREAAGPEQVGQGEAQLRAQRQVLGEAQATSRGGLARGGTAACGASGASAHKGQEVSAAALESRHVHKIRSRYVAPLTGLVIFRATPRDQSNSHTTTYDTVSPWSLTVEGAKAVGGTFRMRRGPPQSEPRCEREVRCRDERPPAAAFRPRLTTHAVRARAGAGRPQALFFSPPAFGCSTATSVHSSARNEAKKKQPHLTRCECSQRAR